MVIALDRHKKPLGVITEPRARKLMEQRRACVCRCMLFVLIIKDVDARDCREIPACRIRIDPGSKYTGIAIVENSTNDFVLGFIIEHRGEQIHKNLDRRRGAGRNRRNRETLYRHSKFVKGKAPTSRKKGWLPPSEMSLVGNIDTWVKRLCRWLPVTSAAMEAVRFDTQLLDDPDIEGKQYQHATLYGYEIKEYLLDKYQHTCQYCGGKSGDQVLEWEHMMPGSRHGSDSVKNAILACHTCNQEKGNMTPQEWLEKIRAKKHPTELDKARIEGIQNVIDHKRTGGSNRYCAWVSATRKKDE